MLNLRLLSVFGAVLLICWVMVPVIFLSPATALAAGGSAADSQYQDPLAGATSTAAAKTETAPTTRTTRRGAITSTRSFTQPAVISTTTSDATVTSSTGVRSAPPTLSRTAPSSIDSNPTQPESLPMTGLNVKAVVLVGLILVAAGAVLRWRTASPPRRPTVRLPR